jgi:hypothetical protein
MTDRATIQGAMMNFDRAFSRLIHKAGGISRFSFRNAKGKAPPT